MSYTAKLSYSVYDLNSSVLVELVKEVLQVEFLNQRTEHGNTYLPQVVKKDEYLLSPVSDKEINPAFCSVIKAKMEGTEQRFSNQQNDKNQYIIGILANGLENLRKIADAVYVILNDMDVRHYFYQVTDTEGNRLISDSGEFYIKALSTEFEVSKTMNNKEIVYGYLILNAEVSEVPKFNTYSTFEGVTAEIKVGEDEKEINLETNIE